MKTLSDLDVYRELISVCDRLHGLADGAASPRTRTALVVAARLVRRLASAVFKAGL